MKWTIHGFRGKMEIETVWSFTRSTLMGTCTMVCRLVILFLLANVLGANMVLADDWPFKEPKTATTITVVDILNGAKPILYVTHDEDDGMWQFLTGDDVEEDQARVVALEQVISKDSSLRELADLPKGWIAWRETATSKWIRQKDE